MNPEDYEPSDETTDDLATAIGWGVFYDALMLNWVERNGGLSTLCSIDHPAGGEYEFAGPFARARLKAPKPRPGDVELRRWCMETGRAVKRCTYPSSTWHWDACKLMWRSEGDWGPGTGPLSSCGYVPEDGKPW